MRTHPTPSPTRGPSALAALIVTIALGGCGGAGDGGDAVPEADPDGDSPGVPVAGDASAEREIEDGECMPSALPASVQAEVSCAPLSDDDRAELLDLVNEARASARACGTEAYPAAPALEWDPCLEAAAAGHSDDMAMHDFFSHTGSDGSEIGMRVTAAGFQWNVVGENIAAGQRSGAAAVRGWVESPGHCRNLMDPRFERMGMSCTSDAGSTYETYWTQVFGRPR